jgi:hypothetical protein
MSACFHRAQLILPTDRSPRATSATPMKSSHSTESSSAPCSSFGARETAGCRWKASLFNSRLTDKDDP